MDAEKIGRMLRMLGPGVSRRDFIRTTAVGAAGTLAAPRAVRAQGTPKKGGTLVYGMEGPSDILDPQATGCWLTYRVTFQMFEGLLAEDLTKADVAVPPLIPRLAESWQVGKDGLTRTFKLRKGVKFHDGTPFNAQAAVFSWERMFKKDAPHFYPRANSYTAYVVEYVTGAEAVDEYTLKLTFSKPYAEWERMTLQSWGEPMMVSPTQVKKLGNEKFANGPVGTGPFRFVENVPGDRIVLERFKEYWGPQANVDKLVFRRLDDPAARVAALRTGEVDFILAPSPDEVDALRKDKFTVLQSNAPHIWYWHLNMKDEYFKDVRVRKAVQMAVDKEKMCKDLLRGTAKPAWSMVPPATIAYDPKYKPYSYNPERAKLDDSKRVAIYPQIDRILMEEDASFLPICNDLNLVVLNPKVKGFVNPPEEWFQLWTPWVEA